MLLCVRFLVLRICSCALTSSASRLSGEATVSPQAAFFGVAWWEEDDVWPGVDDGAQLVRTINVQVRVCDLVCIQEWWHIACPRRGEPAMTLDGALYCAIPRVLDCCERQLDSIQMIRYMRIHLFLRVQHPHVSVARSSRIS